MFVLPESEPVEDAVASANSAYFPAEQTVHDVAPAPEIDPGVQIVHPLATTPSLEKVPAVHISWH